MGRHDQTTPQFDSYQSWYDELRRLSVARDLTYLIATGENAHFKAYQQGLSPDEELMELADMAEWRGCGCGGG